MVEIGTKSGKAACAAALMAAAIGAVALIGWVFHHDRLKCVLAGAVTMSPITALCLVLAGVSFLLSLRARNQPNRNRGLPLVARTCALIVALAGLARLSTLISDWDTGIDQWLFSLQVSQQLPIPSRIAPNTALNLLLFGGALFFIDAKRRAVRLGVEFSVILAGIGSLLAILGYAYDIQPFYRLGFFIPMALSAALAFSLMTVAVLLSRADRGYLAIITGDGAAGVMARRLLPAALLVPAGLGWLTLRGEKAGLFPGEFGEALFAAGNILVFAFLVCWSARGLSRADGDRKKAEEAMRAGEESLRNSQTLARMVGRLGRMGAWSVELPGSKVEFSDEVCAIHEVPAGFAPLVAEAILFYAPEFREPVTTAFETCVRDGTPFDLELQLITAHGRRVWVRSIGEAKRDAAGAIRRVQGALQDISQRKAAEAESRELNERMTTTLESLTDGFFTLDHDWRFTYVNHEAERMLAFPRVELLGSHIWAKLSQARGTVFRHECQRAVRENTAVQFETFYPPLDAWFEARAFPSTQGLAVYLRDITGVRQAGETVRLLSSAVEQSKESIIITNAELDLPGPEIIFVNPAFTKMTGFTPDDAIGKTPRILQGPLTERAVLDRLRQNLERGGTFAGETINYRKDGTEFDLEWQIAPIRDAGGKVTHFVAIQRDITARKQLEAQMFESQKLETVGKLAGGIAHEFNGILTAIIGQSELLLGDLPVGSPLAKNALEITRAAGRAATLTRQLLAYGRKQFLQPETLDLNQVITGMESMLRYLTGGDINLRIVSAAGLYAVRADAGQIEQVIMNMAINAREAMPGGGKLTLETANILIDHESVSPDPELKPGAYVMLAITDTGVGMSAEVRAMAFEPFFTTKSVGQGTGLGLSTCYGIIKQSGGHISIYSEPGRGTSFKIYLPQIELSLETSAPRPSPPDLPRGTETIILVEDDPAMREMAAALLRRLGYVVRTAANGIDALSLTRQPGVGHVDLVFTDVVMPRMSGRELADLVHALYPRTKILFASAYTENAIVHQGMLSPGAAFLEKPFTPSAMARKIREVLDQPATLEPAVARLIPTIPPAAAAGNSE